MSLWFSFFSQRESWCDDDEKKVFRACEWGFALKKYFFFSQILIFIFVFFVDGQNRRLYAT